MNDARSSGGVTFGQLTRLAIVAAFCLLVLAGVGAIVAALSSANAEHWAEHSLQVRHAEARLLSTVQDAETGQRGYLLTGDASYLEPFERARTRLPAILAEVSRLVADNAPQQRRLADLDARVQSKMAELARTVALQRAGDRAGALSIVRTGDGRALMTRIRAIGADFDNAEQQLLARRQAAAALQRSVLLGLVVLAVLVAGILAWFVIVEARRAAAELAGQNAALKLAVDARERTEAQLRQAQKMDALGQLTGGIAHDFNNMLAIIVGFLDMALRRTGESDLRLRTMLENAMAGADRAGSLTKRLLAFSRLQPLDPKACDVNRCVTDMSEMLRRALGEHVAIETVLGGGVWRAYVDIPQLENAILNLAVNGRDAMPNGGRLTIETSNASLDRRYADENAEVVPGQYVLIAITDTGEGMTKEVQIRAFDPFFTTKPVGEGTGLGLSQVHGFLKQSRGHIKLYSELGVGTTVKLYLPRHIGAAPLEEPPPRRAEAPIEGRVTVLVVEDDPGVRGLTVSAVRELGFSVVEADGGPVALERLAANPDIAVMLTDVVMPIMTGRQLADAALAFRPDLQVVYMTGYTRNALVHNGVLDPGARLLIKPFTLDQLDRELREATGAAEEA